MNGKIGSRICRRRFDSDRWDEQIEEDAKSGKLDSLAQTALREFRRGETNPL
jgi:hypothetical protein